jgi:hypothetical protein
LIFGVVFAAGWEVAQSMKTNNALSFLLDFHDLEDYFSAALGKVGASGGVLGALGGLVDDLVGIFCETWQQDEHNGPRLGEVGSKLRARVAKMLPRCPAW